MGRLYCLHACDVTLVYVQRDVTLLPSSIYWYVGWGLVIYLLYCDVGLDKPICWDVMLLSSIIWASRQVVPLSCMWVYFTSSGSVCRMVLNIRICLGMYIWYLEMEDGGITERIFRGGQSHFFRIFFPGVKCFFPIGNFHFGRHKTNFGHFEKWKKKKEKKKRSSPHLLTFPLICNFPPYFPCFLLHFLFFLPLFSR